MKAKTELVEVKERMLKAVGGRQKERCSVFSSKMG